MAHFMYIINNIIQIAVIHFYYCTHRKPRKNFIITEAVVIIPFTIVYLVGTFCFKWTLGNVVFNVCRQLPLIIWIAFLFDEPLKNKIVMYFEYFVIGGLCAIIGSPMVISMFGVTYNEIHYACYMQNAGMMIWSDLTLSISVAVAIWFNRKNDFFKHNKRILLIMIVFPLLHLAFTYAYFYKKGDSLDLQTVITHLFYQSTMIILIIAQFFALKRSHELKQTEDEFVRIQTEIRHTYDYCMLADRKFIDISKMRHDINNQIQAIKQYMAVEKDSAEAEKMINRLQEGLEATRNVQYCSHPIINAVLTPKACMAGDNGISSDIILNDCDNLPFDNYDLCSLFANLFDNAVEACLEIDEKENRFIEVRSVVKGNYFVVKVINSSRPVEFKGSNGVPKTRKKESGHGYGMVIVKSIAEKYNGQTNVKYEDGIFTVTVALGLK